MSDKVPIEDKISMIVEYCIDKIDMINSNVNYNAILAQIAKDLTYVVEFVKKPTPLKKG